MPHFFKEQVVGAMCSVVCKDGSRQWTQRAQIEEYDKDSQRFTIAHLPDQGEDSCATRTVHGVCVNDLFSHGLLRFDLALSVQLNERGDTWKTALRPPQCVSQALAVVSTPEVDEDSAAEAEKIRRQAEVDKAEKELGYDIEFSVKQPNGKFIQVGPHTRIKFQQNNPKRPGFSAHEVYEKYKAATTVLEFCKLNAGREKRDIKRDLDYDAKFGHCTCPARPPRRPAATVAKPAQLLCITNGGECDYIFPEPPALVILPAPSALGGEFDSTVHDSKIPATSAGKQVSRKRLRDGSDEQQAGAKTKRSPWPAGSLSKSAKLHGVAKLFIRGRAAMGGA